MRLAIFDLDHTLLSGDSDHAWGQYLSDIGAVDSAEYAQRNQMFFEQYQKGSLDMDEFLGFSLEPLTRHDPKVLFAWRAEFVEEIIKPMIGDVAHQLVEQHRDAGDDLMIITATNAFVTEPIARLFDIPHLLATRPTMVNGRYTGGYEGTPTFKDGKRLALNDWLNNQDAKPEKTWFYSDSHNDLPLLQNVDVPVAVNPDPILQEHAEKSGWSIVRFSH